MSDVTLILRRMQQGEPGADAELMTAVYEELRRMAAQKMAHEPAGLTLQPTALVHEAWLRLGGDQQPVWRSRAQFFAAAAEAMRRILIERARRRHAARHGGGQMRVDFDDVTLLAPAADDERLLEISDALDQLAAIDPQKAELVKLRYFVGFTVEETAETLGISEATAKRWWVYARTWLFQRIHSDPVAPRPTPP